MKLVTIETDTFATFWVVLARGWMSELFLQFFYEDRNSGFIYLHLFITEPVTLFTSCKLSMTHV